MNGVSVYKETSITTQSKGKLVVLLYEGAIRFLKQAVVEMERKNYEAKGKLINKAQDILYELNSTLNMEEGGEISQNLRSLYNFMIRHLAQANFKCDPKLAQDVIKLLEELNQGWKAITT